MNRFSFVFRAAALFAFVFFAASFTQAQALRTWLSGVGDDANPCSRTAPCKTFAGAISKTAAGGEMSVLDPAGYGPVTITKAITINGGGMLSGISASGTNAIIVNAGANDVVTIKDISITGTGSGLNGIRYLAGKALHVENVWFGGFTGNAIDAQLNGAGHLFVDDVMIKQCGNGIRMTSSTDLIFATINNTRVADVTGDGFQVQNGARATIRNSVAAMNGGNGITLDGVFGNAGVNLENVLLDKNNIGLSLTAAYVTAQLSGVTITNNNTGINNFANQAYVVSFGNNRISGNAFNGGPTSTVGQQ